MNTKDLFDQYRTLLKTDLKAASVFAEQHKENELFTSLVEFRKELLPAIVEAFTKDPKIDMNDPVTKKAVDLSVEQELAQRILKKLDS